MAVRHGRRTGAPATYAGHRRRDVSTAGAHTSAPMEPQTSSTVTRWIGGERAMPSQLTLFEDARRREGALNRMLPHVAAVDLRRIVGSVDATKAATLTKGFVPRQGRTRAPRYRAVLHAMQADVPLPAIEVYGLCGAYYVVDGHHRVAAARA